MSTQDEIFKAIEVAALSQAKDLAAMITVIVESAKYGGLEANTRIWAWARAPQYLRDMVEGEYAVPPDWLVVNKPDKDGSTNMTPIDPDGSVTLSNGVVVAWGWHKE